MKMDIASDPLALQSAAYRDGAGRGAAYLDGLSARKVAATTTQLRSLDRPLPDTGMSADAVLALMDEVGAPGSVATAAGRYFGYVVGGALPAASGARAMLSAWDQIADRPTGPSVLVMEEVALRWVADLLGLPGGTEGVFTTGATMANLALLATARDELLARAGWPRGRGLIGAPSLRIVAGAEIHATVLKSLRLAGLGSEAIERVPVDDQGRMVVDALPRLDVRTLVLAQAGNVCTGASDPFAPLVAACREAGAWLHVDGAFGLWGRAAPATAHGLVGVEGADSWVVDAHKWLNVPYDSGIALTRHPEAMRATMAMGASYLPPTAPSPADLAPEFSRAARGAECWAALLSLGREGVADLVARCHGHACHIADGLREMGFILPHRVWLNQVFAIPPKGGRTGAEIAAAVQASGEAWFGPASWQGQDGFRISVSNWATTERDVERLLLAVKAAALASARHQR
ncbi:MAG: aminotransferase class V-fold PLP-dependent enzyme [Pseudomonadota bacterium]